MSPPNENPPAEREQAGHQFDNSKSKYSPGVGKSKSPPGTVALGNGAAGAEAGGARPRRGHDGYPHGEEPLGPCVEDYVYPDKNGYPYLMVRRHEFFDENGKKIKSFPQYHWVSPDPLFPAAGHWESGAPKGPKVPYNLPQLLKAEKGTLILVCEGEKDADTATDIFSAIGMVATCNSGGAAEIGKDGKLKGWATELNQYYAGHDVLLFEDNDPSGKQHVQIVARELTGVAASIQVGRFREFGPHFDLTEFYELRKKEGKSDEEIREELLARAHFALALDKLASLPLTEIDSAKEQFCKEWKLKPATLNRALKAYHKDRERDAFEAAQAASQEKDASGRKKISVPPIDGEDTPVMEMLDEALTTDEPEPPMRDLARIPFPVEVRMREPMGVHTLTSDGANAAEEGDEYTRLPPPATYMLTPHDSHSLKILIEKYIMFFKLAKNDAGYFVEVPVGLPNSFVQAYLAYRNSTLPRVGMVATMPMVLPDGEILATNGLDAKRKIVFRIEPELLCLLPKETPDDAAIAAAMKFLADEWLCDVQTDWAGKCALIALALSIIERALFSDRPVFWGTAGKRGGGKTTMFNMISVALFGKRAAAAAWSTNEEERRKAIFALLLQGMPFVVWDNIPRGTTISCPHIEKCSTAETYQDRVLGVSRNETPSCATINAFTGNNVGPKGDLASRSLTTRITVDRPDPENREFKHPDPISWTLDHRGQILAAFYTILLGNPRLRQAREHRSQPKTRFKDWWHLVGAPIEYAAEKCGQAIDFGQTFLDVEGEDEEAATTADVLRILDRRWPNEKRFRSSDITPILEHSNTPSHPDAADAAVLKTLLPTDKREGAISGYTVTVALSHIVDAPTLIDEKKSLMLKKERNATGTTEFWIIGPATNENAM